MLAVILVSVGVVVFYLRTHSNGTGTACGMNQVLLNSTKLWLMHKEGESGGRWDGKGGGVGVGMGGPCSARAHQLESPVQQSIP